MPRNIRTRVVGVALASLIWAVALLAGGCAADHHHHPRDWESTDAAFHEYFLDKTRGAEGVSSPPPSPYSEAPR